MRVYLFSMVLLSILGVSLIGIAAWNFADQRDTVSMPKTITIPRYVEPNRTAMYKGCLGVGLTLTECECHETVLAPLKTVTPPDIDRAIHQCSTSQQ